jgi:hypothetical protein
MTSSQTPGLCPTATAMSGSEPDSAMGPAFPSGRYFRICGWRCRWLAQVVHGGRSLKGRCGPNAQLTGCRATECRAGTSLVGGLSRCRRAAPRRQGAVAPGAISDDCAAARGRSRRRRRAVRSVRSQSSQDCFPWPPRGRTLVGRVAPGLTWTGRACIHPRRQRSAVGRWRPPGLPLAA